MIMIVIRPKFRFPISCNFVIRPKANEHFCTTT